MRRAIPSLWPRNTSLHRLVFECERPIKATKWLFGDTMLVIKLKGLIAVPLSITVLAGCCRIREHVWNKSMKNHFDYISVAIKHRLLYIARRFGTSGFQILNSSRVRVDFSDNKSKHMYTYMRIREMFACEIHCLREPCDRV